MGSTMAMQVDCSGLGSKADARKEAKAMRAIVTKKLTPFFITRVLSSSCNKKYLSLGEGWEILHGEDVNLWTRVLELVFYLTI